MKTLGTTFFASALALVAGCSGGTEAPSAGAVSNAASSLRAPTGDVPTDPCAAVRCRAGTECVVVDGSATCADDLGTNPCAAVTCLVGTTCEVVEGEAVCTPSEPNPCAAVTCLVGTSCEVIDGEAVCSPIGPSGPFCGGIAAIECPGSGSCVDAPGDGCSPENGGADCGGVCVCPVLALCIEGLIFDPSPEVCACVPDPALDPCAAVRCAGGTECVVVDGSAVCEPVENPCAAVLCAPDSTCEVVDGQAVCSPIEPPSGPFCGGFAGIGCAGAGSCIDDPSDDCDPDNGGADCGGSCQCLVRALCIQGFSFDQSPEVCACVPAPEENPCALVDCFPNQTCEVQDGEAVCVPVEPNPCAAVLCPVGDVCVVDGDEARCEAPQSGPDCN